jgi:hypothetical protein
MLGASETWLNHDEAARRFHWFLYDFVANRESWGKAAPPELVRNVGWWDRAAMTKLIGETLPGAAIAAYDGTEAHAVNRVLLRKPI